MANIYYLEGRTGKVNKTVGELLLKKEKKKLISEEEKKKVSLFVEELEKIIIEGIDICKLENTLSHGDIVCTIISFEKNRIEVYIGNVLIGKIGVYDFLSQENSFMFIEYKQYLELLLKRQGLEIKSLYTKFPAIFEIRLI